MTPVLAALDAAIAAANAHADEDGWKLDCTTADFIRDHGPALRAALVEREALCDALLECYACYAEGGTLSEDAYAAIDAARGATP
jgi:hypothetical protein